MARLKYLLILLLAIAASCCVEAQELCTGNLGENVFLDGDFGTGADQILQQDPRIALDYFYELNPPPFDGEYTITNNSDWLFKYGTWLGIGDNSPDPNGYMMVVNADFTPGIFFEQIVTGLCENTTYVFSADIINMIMRGVPDHLDPDVSFLLDDQEFFTTGLIPKSEQWNTYGFTFTAGTGQTEVKLTLRNNAPGGTGNDLALDNISFRACGPDASIIAPSSKITLCPDSAPSTLQTNVSTTDFNFVQWQLSQDEGDSWNDIAGANDQMYTHAADFDPGRYAYRFYAAQSAVNLSNTLCRIVSDTTVIEILPIEFYVIDTICEGAVFALGQRDIATSGNYTATLMGRRGCDSLVTLDLTVIPDPQIQLLTDVTGPSCFGLADGVISVTEVINGTRPFTYIFEQDTSVSSVFSSLSSGEYELSVLDRYLCRDDRSILMESSAEFVIDLGADLEVLLGETVTLVPTASEEIISFSWDPILADSACPNCLEPSFIPFDDALIRFTATNAEGCTATDALQIRVDKDYSIYIPNSFSPNEDGTNDTFILYARSGLVDEIEELLIMDRWGNIIYEHQLFQPNDAAAGWDGSYQGQRIADGSYVYSARVRYIDQRVETLSGSIDVIY